MKKILIVFASVMSAMVVAAAVSGPRLVPDYNRDGKINDVDYERLAKGETFTIWLNDDDDAEGAKADEGKGDTNFALYDVPSGEGNDKDCEDDIVNGRCDLLDFFPVLVDVTGVGNWANYDWKLSSKSVNAVFTKLRADTAGDFHTKDVRGFDGETSLYWAAVEKLAEEDVKLPDGFFSDESEGRGVILIEGAALAEGGLTLRGEKSGIAPVEVTLNLAVANVESLYDWMNLRSTSTSSPSTDSRHFVFVHGYNMNHEEARGNAAEFYKKLYQSGSDARFTAVEWCGDQSQIKFEILGVNITPNYFVNVENAFAAAKPFAEACEKLPGEKILVGHGLGNVLISSAIKDFGLDYTKFVMLDAEIASKDFEADGRFANLPRTINYYSSSDSFFAESTLDVENYEELRGAIVKEAGFWSLNEKIKNSQRAIELVNGILTNVFDIAETDVITPAQLAHAGIIEMPAAGANSVTTLENVNVERFIEDTSDHEWPVREEVEDEGGGRKNEWKHSTFREVAFYHTSKFYASLAAVGKPRIILDTDLGSCMDDLFTVDLASRMHREGKLELMAVMMNRPDKSDVDEEGEFLKFADRYLASLGLGDLPLGKSEPLAIERLPQRVLNPYWTLIYSNDVANVGLLMPTNRTDEQLASLSNAVSLYRRLLEDAPDKSVIICSTGFLTNLKGLMESGLNCEGDGIRSTGLELIEAKVKELRIMAGCFDPDSAPTGTDGAEYNAAGDPEAAKKILEEWPTPVIVSPWEVGLKLEYKPNDVLADFPLSTFNPTIRAVYERWPEPPSGVLNRLWDPMTVLPLIEGETLAPLSEKGGILVDENGKTTFNEDASSNRCYQVASEMNVEAVMNRFRKIFSEPMCEGGTMKKVNEVWVITPNIGVTEVTIKNLSEEAKLAVKLNGYNVQSEAFMGFGEGRVFSLALKPDFVQPIVGDLDEPFVVSEGKVVLTIKTIPGLKYSLIRGAEIGAITETVVEPTLATGEKMTLEDDISPTGKAFYKVGIGK